jgi:ribulose-5-phosphate 4-epimerase/fuculose-1-phosphate aldolase
VRTSPHDLALASRILARHGLIGLAGHVSVYPGSGSRYLICPGAGSRKDLVRAEDIFELDFADEWRPGLPLELYMHAAVHRLSPQVGSLVHVHSPALTRLGLLAEVPGDVLHFFMASFWPRRMPLYDVPDLVRSHADGVRMANILGDQAVILLPWHGACIAGASLELAVFRAVHAEQHAELLLGSLAHGRPLRPLPDEAFAKHLTDDRLVGVHWSYEASYVEE